MEPFESLSRALAGRYHIERELGRGGMATVYLAHDLKQDRRVALKLLSPELSHLHGPERFLREIALTARLQHPNILPLFDSGEAGERLWYVMPYVEGESLKARLEREGKLPVAEAGRLARELADALACAHRAGIIHRDVKPANILLSDGHALLADFGIAHVTGAASRGTASDSAEARGRMPAPDNTLTVPGGIVGTPSYMSPEQVLGEQELTPASDVYALGCVLYEMLTGRPLVSGASPFAVLAPEPDDGGALAGVQEQLAAVVRRAVSWDVAARYRTAEEIGAAVEAALALESEAGRAVQRSARRSRLLAMAAVAAVIGLAGFAAMALSARGRREDALRQLQEAQRLAATDYQTAFALAQPLLEALPGDSALASLWQEVAMTALAHTDPPGAKVSVRAWVDGPEPRWAAAWQDLGITPDSAPLPRDVIHRVRYEKEGYRTVELVTLPLTLPGIDAKHVRLGVPSDSLVRLDPVDSLPGEMVRVPGFALDSSLNQVPLPGPHPSPGARQPLVIYRDFFMDRLEVSNRDYQVFVDSGGYARPEFWTHPFVEDGRTLTRAEALAKLVDRTGRPAPSTWSLGHYPDGEADLPVGGISWYEAEAYAAFRGKSLPTVDHWYRTAWLPANAFSHPLTNLAGAGPVAVGRSDAIGTYGTYDMVGNVREWLYNDDRGSRWILGGGWTDQDLPGYGSLPPFDRSPQNGLRLARYFEDPATLARARAPRPATGYRNYSKERPVGEAEFRAIRRLYQYEREPLATRVERVDTAEHWIRKRLTFAPAYPGERMILYLYLPRSGKPPYQPVVYFAGAGVQSNLALPDDWAETAAFLVRQGRAVALPALRGTLDRDTALDVHFTGWRGRTYNVPLSFVRDLVIQWSKDVQRTVDYIESDPELDAGRIGYYGYSWGGTLAPVMLATEPRFKAAVLYVAGLRGEPALPEADEFNFLPRVTLPLLMVSGRHDPIFNLQAQQQPFYRLLGTPAAHKRHHVSAAGHQVPGDTLWRETLAWFDRYLGPVAAR